MDGQVRNVKYIEDKDTIYYLRNTIKEYCNFKKDVFPGSQPVSLERSRELDNLKLLAEEEYMVSWKADGMRYLVLIKDEDQIYAFDRDNNVFELNGISFPHRKGARHVVNTLIDAEMVIEHIAAMNGDPARVRPRLLIYDIVKFEDTQLGHCDFKTRFDAIDIELIKPRHEAAKIFPANEPMGIRRKDFYLISATAKLLSEDFTKTLCHEVDGLIFQPVRGVSSILSYLIIFLLGLRTRQIRQTFEMETARSVDY
jgi:mRNA-capping enzyme